MKFESKIGLGEIVIVNSIPESATRNIGDQLGKVISVGFDKNGTNYLVDVQDKSGIKRMQFPEADLLGDPLFDQEAGEYPEE